MIIVDTMPGLGRPGEIRVVAVDPDDVAASDGSDPHGMDPGRAVRTIARRRTASTYVVGAQPANLEEGSACLIPCARLCLWPAPPYENRWPPALGPRS